ncbi:hypothetical protein [Fictibacillus arsenicus]|uniref:Uncharacterized protein n=1 Tax=Fictibacillus arsenicus TaxID=255247 RepID=A0A1V3GAZ9_9BACL|nr:hypothetical protein [Fictibacillus arsenicus]OOE14039.1 hypothetical protein UN64_02160 [Fictibacillus arsenicus]
MKKGKLLSLVLGGCLFGAGFAGAHFNETANAGTVVYDTSTCTVAHSGTGNTCNNYTYGYSWQGGGTFQHTHSHKYTGYSSSITYTNQKWDPTSVTAGDPFYNYAWVSDKGVVDYYGRSYSGTLFRDVSYISISMNNNVSLTGQSTLRMISDIWAAGSDNQYTYDAITYPR